jgi:hypothetical protein
MPEGLRTIVEKIKVLIGNCDDTALRKKYKTELEKLITSESLKDIYFFKELHDSILAAEKTRKAKIDINTVLSSLNTLLFHDLTKIERQNLIQHCLNMLNRSNISKDEADDLQTRFERLKSESRLCVEEDEIKNKERLFLKSQIILCLENQGYEVMDDMEVIDFEKGDDFFLKIKGQENYLNLKFKEDGSMRYAFKIPENKDNLSTDQQNMKLEEMRITCQDFKEVLKDLSKMGLKINLKSEKPIAFDSIVSITETRVNQLRTMAKSRKQKSQLRKKYLDQ